MNAIFIHGLDSSSRGTKATWFREHFPEMLLPDFNGPFSQRLEQLKGIVADREDLIIIGSSFGGLMAAAFALEQYHRILRLILLAPALNFPEFADYPASACPVPTLLFLGRRDTVCPSARVLPAACQHFLNLTIHQTDDDHLLRRTFPTINWHAMLAAEQPGNLSIALRRLGANSG